MNKFAKKFEIILTMVGLILVIFEWLIPYKQSKKSEKEQRDFEKKLLCYQWQKEMLDKQISSFYGPISELIREQDLRFALIRYQIGRKKIFTQNKENLSYLTEDEQKIWAHFIDTYCIPTQKRIIEIIQTNQHLIHNSKMPECFRPYMGYVLGWELLDNQKRNNVPNYYEYHYLYNYPTEFNYYIENTLSILLKRQKELIDL